tara:strand:- start:1361 stop:1903 length:543 start_codon:yes stop_codon:yes gene_type:complete
MSTLHVENLKGLSSGGNANKIIVPSGQTIDASAGTLLPSAGQIVQALTQEITAITTSTTATQAASGFTLTITPKSTSSKIRCTVGINGIHANTVNSCVGFHLYKNGSHIKYLEDVVGYASSVSYANNATIMATDSPNTTSAVTYAIYWNRAFGSGTVYFNNYASGSNRTRSWFTVEEIAQ